jgi:hypothetical protein
LSLPELPLPASTSPISLSYRSRLDSSYYGYRPAGPYYPDVVGLAQDLLKGRVINLDELLLDGRLPGRPDPQSR